MLKQNTMNTQQEILLSLDAEDLQQRYLRKVSTPTSPTENSLSPKDPRSPMGSRTRSFSDFNSAILPVNSLSAPQVRFFLTHQGSLHNTIITENELSVEQIESSSKVS